ncbi:hypothetical protein [Chromatium okenii]|uniref:hypothetical protein n=1 Tax=Chromatium okenii TaxID=61644 RepID=UPI0026F230C0|nr:hypothetical protein [Chromatium okenii]MBV5309973.1 hypothetical protein [Chromatium okenii]
MNIKPMPPLTTAPKTAALRWQTRLGLLAQRLLGTMLLIVIAWVLRDQPVAQLWIAGGLALYFIVLWRYPAAWLVILPALLPVLDLTPWTGRLYFGEYDLFVALTLALGLLRGVLSQRSPLNVRGFYPALGVFIAANMLGIILEFHAGAAELTAEYAHYFSPFNSLRVAKGLFAALLLFAMLEQSRQQQRPVALLLSIGLVLGLLLAGLSIIWERLMFTGPFDFSQSYRATGLFSAMHLGGASIDGFLALTLPFIAALFMVARGRLLQIGGLLLFMLALYAFLVTFSRANYLAFAGMTALAIAGDYVVRRGKAARPTQTLKWTLLGTLMITAIAVPILGGGFVHSSRVFDALDDSVTDILFGRGVGSFPRVFQDEEINKRHQYLAQFNVLREPGNRFVRFSASDSNGSLFLRQRLLPGHHEATLSLRMRGQTTPPDKLLIELCEMNILRSKSECQWLGITLDAAKAGEWAEYSKSVDLINFGRSLLGFSRPVDLMLLNRGLTGAVDIDDVRLTAPDGTNLLANGDFETNFDHWLFNPGDHLLWHAKNIFLHVWFETGLIGLAAFVLVLLIAFNRLFNRIEHGDRWALVLLIALSGFLILGAFDTLIDDPRIALLFFLLLFAAISPATLELASSTAAFLPWAKLVKTAILTVPALGIVVVAHTFLTQKLSPPELVRLALKRADIDWPWLHEALTPAPSPAIPIGQLFPEWQPLPTSHFAPDAQSLRIGMRTFYSMQEAASALKSGDTLDIGAGVYDTPLVIEIDNVTIRGHGHVILEKGTAKDKGNMLIQGNNVQIKNLECRLISVSDGNGACIRLEGTNLSVEHVYFHDSDQGILTGADPGIVRIRDSRFQQLGLNGLAHAIYIGGGELHIEDSLFLASKSEGHEIKSRAQITTIKRSIIASLTGVDSRLIDISNGGTLVVEDSLLAKGPNSSNLDAVGFALEKNRQSNHRVILRGNIIFLERTESNRLLHLGNDKTSVDLFGNLIISKQNTGYEDGNFIYKERKAAGFPEYPALPIERFLKSPSAF